MGVLKVNVSRRQIYRTGGNTMCTTLALEMVRVKQGRFFLQTPGINLKIPPCSGLQNDMPRVQLRSMEWVI